jgi:arginine deiminase
MDMQNAVRPLPERGLGAGADAVACISLDAVHSRIERGGEPKMPGLHITSEIGALKRVIVHSPGPEVEAMTPKEAEADLYNDIIPLQAMRSEFDVLKAFLAQVSEVFELKDLLAQVLADAGNRYEFLDGLAQLCPIRARMEELMGMGPAELARVAIEGLPALPGSLPGVLSKRSFSLRPLPNTYFMRDSAAVVRDWAISSATAYDVRLIEAVIARFIFRRHPDFLAKGLLIDGPRERSRFITIEGGDVVALSRNVLAVGVSERTTADSVERLASAAARAFGEDMTVFAVVLPRERACIHLDMVFTAVDRDAALVYAPIVTGPNPGAGRAHRRRPRRRPPLRRGGGPPPGTLGRGDGPRAPELRRERSPVPGARAVVVGSQLLRLRARQDHHVLLQREEPRRPLRPPASPSGKRATSSRARLRSRTSSRLAVTFEGIELARGGGGARCMTMPVEREDVAF